jgi:hypothetical protein
MSATGLPDSSCTPGVANPAVTQGNIGQTICVSGYTATIRPPSSYTDALKVQQMVAYGETTMTTADVEEDHLIPLEAGGDPRDPRNLWPEPWNDAGVLLGAHSKDKVENWARDEICSGTQTLATIQQLIASNWLAAYAEANGSPPPTIGPTAVPTITPTPAPAGSQPPAAFSVTIVTSQYGSLAATTLATANCTARARLPSGNYSQAQGITVAKVADANGAVSWTYTRVSSTTPGTGTHTVSCTLSGQTVAASAAFTVP